jgi:hypothetical protein
MEKRSAARREIALPSGKNVSASFANLATWGRPLIYPLAVLSSCEIVFLTVIDYFDQHGA